MSAMPELPPGFVLETPQQTQGLPPLPPGFQLEQRQPVQPASMWDRFKQGVTDMPTGLWQAISHMLGEEGREEWLRSARHGFGRALAETPSAAEADKAVTARENEYQARLKAAGHTGIDWARIGGNAVTSLPMMGVPGGQTYLGAAGIGALTGAGMNALSPVPNAGDNYGREMLANAVTGAKAGAAGGVLGKAVGGLLAPRIEPNVRTLADAGVELTPGQIVGGVARKLEDSATSIPVIGTGVANAQRRSLESFNRAVGDEVLAPLGKTVPKDVAAGRALVNHVDDTIGDAYRAAHAKVTPIVPDAQFGQDFQALMANNILMPDQRDFFRQFMSRQLLPRMQKGPMTGESLQEITSELKRYARSYGSSANVPDREMAKVFRGLVDMFDDLTVRTNPAVAPEIKGANAAFARMIRMESAAGGAGATEGVFTAPQFSAAVRRSDMSPRKGEFARGTALMQDISDPAKAVLPSTVPDSGTGLRGMLGALIGTGATGMISPATAAAYAGTTAAGRLAYSEPATRAFRAAMLARRPDVVQALGEGARRAGQASGAPLARMLMEGNRAQ